MQKQSGCTQTDRKYRVQSTLVNLTLPPDESQFINPVSVYSFAFRLFLVQSYASSSQIEQSQYNQV